jgi:hypothetical protein
MDVYAKVTEQIVAALETAEKWQQPWTAALGTGTLARPINAASRRPYRGINVPLLWSAQRSTPHWATYKQWRDVGAQVRRGERASLIIFWKQIERPAGDDGEGEDDGDETRRRLQTSAPDFLCHSVVSRITSTEPEPVKSDAVPSPTENAFVRLRYHVPISHGRIEEDLVLIGSWSAALLSSFEVNDRVVNEPLRHIGGTVFNLLVRPKRTIPSKFLNRKLWTAVCGNDSYPALLNRGRRPAMVGDVIEYSRASYIDPVVVAFWKQNLRVRIDENPGPLQHYERVLSNLR